jgi:Protein of unknown function (DUF2807).
MIALSVMLLATAASFTASAITVDKSYDYDDFYGLSVSNSFDVKLVKGNSYCVEVEVSEEYADYLNVRVEKGILYIGFDKLPLKLKNMKDVIAKAEVTAPEFRSLKLSGASTFECKDSYTLVMHKVSVDVSGSSTVKEMHIVASKGDVEVSGTSEVNLDFEVGELDFVVSGASKVKGNIDVADVDVKVSGASKVELAGKGLNADIEVSGASSALLEDLELKAADVEASGASKVKVDVAVKLEVDASGASSIHYKEHKMLNINTKNIGHGSALKKLK